MSAILARVQGLIAGWTRGPELNALACVNLVPAIPALHVAVLLPLKLT